MIGQAELVERVGEDEHDRVVSPIVVGVNIRMRVAHSLQHLNEHFGLIVLRIVPLVQIALSRIVYHVYGLIDRFGWHHVRQLLVLVYVKCVREVNRLNFARKKKRH